MQRIESSVTVIRVHRSPTRVVLSQMDNGMFATHLEMMETSSRAYLTDGVYNMKEQQARKNVDERVAWLKTRKVRS